MAIRRVLSVGQCGVGNAAIRRLFRQRFDADVVPAPGSAEAVAELHRGHYDLVLVNRVFYRGGLGLELIAAIKTDPSLQGVPVILVSDLPAAQQRAEDLGAEPGFGKAALARPETSDRIAAALHHAASAAGG
jgi:CheY-like chemotaxis protein